MKREIWCSSIHISVVMIYVSVGTIHVSKVAIHISLETNSPIRVSASAQTRAVTWNTMKCVDSLKKYAIHVSLKMIHVSLVTIHVSLPMIYVSSCKNRYMYRNFFRYMYHFPMIYISLPMIHVSSTMAHYTTSKWHTKLRSSPPTASASVVVGGV